MDDAPEVTQVFEHVRQGRVAEAERLARALMTARPEDPDSLHAAAMVCIGQNRLPGARDFLNRALALKPDAPDIRRNLATVLRMLGEKAQAVRMLEDLGQAAEPQDRKLLGELLLDLGRNSEALDLFRRLADAKGADAAILLGLARARMRLKQFREAEGILHELLDRHPDHNGAKNALSITLYHLGRTHEAAQTALALARKVGNQAGLFYNAGKYALMARDLTDAREALEKALSLEPAHAAARATLGHLHLLEGRWAEGFAAYDWRFKAKDFPVKPLPGPQWDGSPLDGAPIALLAEQGLGDAVQFIRYAALVKERGGRVLVSCPPALEGLLTVAEGVDEVHVGTPARDSYSRQAALMSLPGLFATTPETVPATIPYLHPAPERVARWRARLAGEGLAVGLAWESSPVQETTPFKSCPLEALARVLEVPGARFFSLQKNPPPEFLPAAVTDLAPELETPLHTAEAVAALDLVITVDTFAAHLAGALGRETWVLLFHGSDWRWGLAGETCPWYPTARLFRQERPGDWSAPLAALRDSLHAKTGRG